MVLSTTEQHLKGIFCCGILNYFPINHLLIVCQNMGPVSEV